MKNVLFIGNSHLISLIDAAKRHVDTAADVREEADFNWRGTAFKRYDFNLAAPVDAAASSLRFILLGGAAPSLFQVNAQGQFSLAPTFLQELQEGAQAFEGRLNTVVSYFHGNEHSIFSMVEHPVPFDFFLGADDTASPTERGPRQVVPLEVVKRELRGRAKPTVLYCQILRQMFPGLDVVHCMPPPPIGDEQQLRKNPEIFAQHFQLFGVAPPALRLKVYALYAQVLAEELRAVGVRVLAAPAESQVDGGFLRPDSWMESTHANHHYGQLLLNELGAV
jgi:hypothetical protein